MSTERHESRLGLKLLALGIATLLWFFGFLDRPREKGLRVVDASVSYIPPKTMVLLDEVSTVKVRIEGKPQVLSNLDERMVSLLVDLSEASAGPMQFPVGPDDISVPGELEVVSVTPNLLQLELDYVDTKPLPVRVEFTGEPAAGSRPLEAQTIPREAAATGPRSILENYNFLSAVVNLDTHAVSFEETVELRRPHPLISLQPSRVRVEVRMESPGMTNERAEGGRP